MDGKILDGRNRYLACERAGIEPRFAAFQNGLSPVAYVLSKNAGRRHLSESQRAMVAAKLATGKHGGDRRSENQETNMSLENAASLLNVSAMSIKNAKFILKHDAELAEAVANGEVTVCGAMAQLKKVELQAEAMALPPTLATQTAQKFSPRPSRPQISRQDDRRRAGTERSRS